MTNEQQMIAIKAWFEEKTREDGCVVTVDEYNPETRIAWVSLTAGGWCSGKEYQVIWDGDKVLTVHLLNGRYPW